MSALILPMSSSSSAYLFCLMWKNKPSMQSKYALSANSSEKVIRMLPFPVVVLPTVPTSAFSDRPVMVVSNSPAYTSPTPTVANETLSSVVHDLRPSFAHVDRCSCFHNWTLLDFFPSSQLTFTCCFIKALLLAYAALDRPVRHRESRSYFSHRGLHAGH
jgi:hypothetical protein